jgi:acyl carrier protein
MTHDEMIAKVNEIMIQGFEIDPALLKPEARLREDLGLDSLDGVDLVVAVEKKTGLRIDESAARSMRTLQDIYSYLEGRAQTVDVGTRK